MSEMVIGALNRNGVKSLLSQVFWIAILITCWCIWSIAAYRVLSFLANPWLDNMPYIPPVGHWQRTMLDFWLHGGTHLVVAALLGINLYQFKQSLDKNSSFAKPVIFHAVTSIAGILGLLALLISAVAFAASSGITDHLPQNNYWEKYSDYRVRIPFLVIFLVYFALFFVTRKKIERWFFTVSE